MIRFPKTRFVDESGIARQLLHVASEIWEIIKALIVCDLEHAVHESFDAIGSLETLIYKIIKRAAGKGVTINATLIAYQVKEKNQLRGYYDMPVQQLGPIPPACENRQL